MSGPAACFMPNDAARFIAAATTREFRKVIPQGLTLVHLSAQPESFLGMSTLWFQHQNGDKTSQVELKM